jgi:hypothetical protein
MFMNKFILILLALFMASASAGEYFAGSDNDQARVLRGSQTFKLSKGAKALKEYGDRNLKSKKSKKSHSKSGGSEDAEQIQT